jgi:hypothetical protein
MNNGYFTWRSFDIYKYFLFLILFGMGNLSDKSCRENQKHILCSITFFRKSRRLWDNVEKYGWARQATDDVAIWRMRVACWISKTTYTHAHVHAHALGHTHAQARTHTRTCNMYFFSTATMIRERASILRYTYNLRLILHTAGVAVKWNTIMVHWWNNSGRRKPKYWEIKRPRATLSKL